MSEIDRHIRESATLLARSEAWRRELQTAVILADQTLEEFWRNATAIGIWREEVTTRSRFARAGFLN